MRSLFSNIRICAARFHLWNFSDYAVGDIGGNDVCIGEPYNDEVLARMQSIHGGPLICLNEKGAPVLSGIASRNSKSIKNGSPGIFTNIYVLRRVLETNFTKVENLNLGLDR